MLTWKGENRDACLCDKMFSEKLAQIDSQCISDMQMGNQNSPFCINEEFRTVNGGGDFDPFDTSEGRFQILFKSHYDKIRKDSSESNRGLFQNLITTAVVTASQYNSCNDNFSRLQTRL